MKTQIYAAPAVKGLLLPSIYANPLTLTTLTYFLYKSWRPNVFLIVMIGLVSCFRLIEYLLVQGY